MLLGEIEVLKKHKSRSEVSFEWNFTQKIE